MELLHFTMEKVLVFLLIVFSFRIVRTMKPLIRDSNSSDLNLSEFYEHFAKDLVSVKLIGTHFCESILLPTNHALKKSLDATLFKSRNGTHLNDGDRLDLCCRSLHKCGAYKNIELNHTNGSNVPHCECVYSFRSCLKNLNTSISNEVAFIHSINSTKCYTVDHPIITCKVFEEYPESMNLFFERLSSTERKTFKRCTKYDLDEGQPKKLQLFDLPFVYEGINSSVFAMAVNSEMKDEINNGIFQIDGMGQQKFTTDQELYVAIRNIFKLGTNIGCEVIKRNINKMNMNEVQKKDIGPRDLEFINELLQFLGKAMNKLILLVCLNEHLIENESHEICEKPTVCENTTVLRKKSFIDLFFNTPMNVSISV